MREPGYYWVKMQPFDTDLHIAKWTGKYWLLHGETFTIGDRSFHEIYPDPITREIAKAKFRLDKEALIIAAVIATLIFLYIRFIIG